MPDINFPMMIIRKRLSETEGQPPDTRYNPDTGTVETSVDGVTWTPNPGADPRRNTAYLLPSLEEGQNCEAAGGMVNKMQEYVLGATTITALPALATFILSGMVFLIPLSWLFALALALAGTILTIGASAIATAFTSEVWDEILCILYCNIGENGQVSQAQLDRIYDQVSSEIGDLVVTTIVGQIFQAWGHVGMSNAGTYIDPEADCSECDDCVWIYRWTFANTDGALDGWGAAPGFAGYAVYNAGFGWRSGTNLGLVLGIQFPDTEIVQIIYGGQWSNSTTGGVAIGFYWRNNGANLRVHLGSRSGGAGHYLEGDGAEFTLDEIWCNPASGSTSFQLIEEVTISGRGTMPAWTQGEAL